MLPNDNVSMSVGHLDPVLIVYRFRHPDYDPNWAQKLIS